MRPPAGFISAFYDPLRNPNAPTIGTATAVSNTSASITFTAPTNVGGGAITGYIATARRASDGTSVGVTGASSPITITGLVTGATYTITVAAVNSFGPSAASAASNSVVVEIIQGQQAYTTAGTYSWVAPTGVTSVSVVAVGGGGAAVISSGTGTVAQDSYFINTSTVKGGFGGNGTEDNSTFTGDGGGAGGAALSQAGAGAGGYSGSGGDGGGLNGANGSGGGGGGGRYDSSGSGGGGVGILGEGVSGAGAVNGTTGGGGGSGGATPAGNASGNTAGGAYGGGGGGNGKGGCGGALGYKNNIAVTPGSSYTVVVGRGGSGTYASGAVGAVRIIWPGTTRSFPSTNTGDL